MVDELLFGRLVIFAIVIFVAFWAGTFLIFGIEAGLRLGILAPVVVFGSAAVAAIAADRRR